MDFFGVEPSKGLSDAEVLKAREIHGRNGMPLAAHVVQVATGQRGPHIPVVVGAAAALVGVILRTAPI